MFHMYDKKNYKCDVTCSLPPPLSQTVTPSRTPSLESDVLYGRPLTRVKNHVATVSAEFLCLFLLNYFLLDLT